jgi:hypothetical protein
LTSLNLASNDIGGYMDEHYTFIATPEGRYSHTQSYCVHIPRAHIFLISLLTSGPAAIADAIKDMGALTSLNLSSNSLKAEGGKIVAEAIKVTNNAMGVVLVPFSCPSDHWLNCCCLLLTATHRITGHYRSWISAVTVL